VPSSCRCCPDREGRIAPRLASRRPWPRPPGVADEDIHLFVARVSATEGGTLHGVAHEGEDIRRLVVPAADAIAMLDGPDLDNAHSLVALSAFARLHETLRRDWR
jgi:ADP-ribose pyrophosphatase